MHLFVGLGGDDYDHGPYMVTFKAGEISAPINIRIIKNPDLHHEHFHLSIAPSLHKDIGRGYPNIVKVDIKEGEYGIVQLLYAKQC